MKYRRISAVVEAWQNIFGAPYPEWLIKVVKGESGSTLNITTGVQCFDVPTNYWVVREYWHFSLFSPKVFEQSFESVKELTQ